MKSKYVILLAALILTFIFTPTLVEATRCFQDSDCPDDENTLCTCDKETFTCKCIQTKLNIAPPKIYKSRIGSPIMIITTVILSICIVLSVAAMLIAKAKAKKKK